MQIKNISLLLVTVFALCCLFSSVAFATEVEDIEKSDIPKEVEDAIKLKKQSEFKIIPIIDISALGTYSKVSSSDDIGGAHVYGTISPVFRLDKSNYIIPLYYGSYNRERQIVVEEEGGRVYNELMDHSVTLEYKHLLNERLVIKLDGLMRLHYVKEEGYDWSDGLYDYQDFGGAAKIEYKLSNTKTNRSSIIFGGEYYHREYPNYQSLISLATVTAPETDEKDYHGYRPTVTYKYKGRGFGCRLLYSPLYKDFDDKKVIDSNGILADKEREDWFHYGRLSLSYLPQESSLMYGLTLTGIIIDSNQNYYDSRGTVSLSDDVFTDNYYSFQSLNINPKITYIQRLENKKTPATYTLGYSYQIRDYEDRKAQFADGTYTQDTQLDETHSASLQAVYPLTDNISAIATGKYTKGLSNMKYQTYYRYKYDSYYAGAGIRIKY